MSIISVTLDSAEQSGERKADVVSAVRQYSVLFSAPGANDVADAGTASGIPRMGDAWGAGYANLRAKRISTKRRGRSPLVDVIVTYGVTDIDKAGRKSLHPMDRPIKISTGTQTSSVKVDSDRAGEPIVNSAGQILPITIPWSDRSISVTRNEWFYWTRYNDFHNKVNADAWNGFMADAVLCTGITQSFTEEDFEGESVEYYVTTFSFAIRIPRFPADAPALWTERVLNAGTVELIGGKRVPIKDGAKTGQTFSGQTPLATDGSRLPEDANPNWLTVFPFQAKNFDALKLEF